MACRPSLRLTGWQRLKMLEGGQKTAWNHSTTKLPNMNKNVSASRIARKIVINSPPRRRSGQSREFGPTKVGNGCSRKESNTKNTRPNRRMLSACEVFGD